MGLLSLFGFLLCWPNLPRQEKRDMVAGSSKPVSYHRMIREPRLARLFLFRFGSMLGLGMNWTFMPLYAHEMLDLLHPAASECSFP